MYSFVCEAANISNTGNLNALGIFNNISGINFPTVHTRMVYVAQIVSNIEDAGEHKYEVHFIDDDGKHIIPKLQGNIKIREPGFMPPLMLNFESTRFPHPGTYQIDLNIDEQNICSNQITLSQINQK